MKSTNTILMIEDEATLKDWFEMTVRSFHKNLVWAANVDQAVAHMNARDEQFDLIVSDFQLSGSMSGLDFWRMNQKLQPRTPFLLMSALPDKLFHEMVRLGEVCPPFLLKPFTAHEFREAIQVLLKTEEKAKHVVRAAA